MSPLAELSCPFLLDEGKGRRPVSDTPQVGGTGVNNIQNISQKDSYQYDEPQQLRTFHIKCKNITPIQLHLLPSKNVGCPPIIQNKFSCGARSLFYFWERIFINVLANYMNTTYVCRHDSAVSFYLYTLLTF
jgi:hypothetical protein